MPHLKSESPRSAHLLSIARSWHDCRNYEIWNNPCPFKMNGTDPEDDEPDDEPIAPPSRKKDPPPLIPIPARAKKKEDEKKDPRQKGQIDLETPILDLGNLPELGQLPFPFPLFPPPREIPRPAPAREPSPGGQPALPDPASPRLPGLDIQHLPNGIPIIGGGPNKLPTIEQQVEIIKWLSTSFNQAFESRPVISLPQQQQPRPPMHPLQPGALDDMLLRQWVQDSRLAEINLAKQLKSAFKPLGKIVEDTDTNSSIKPTIKQIITAGAGTAAALTGFKAISAYRGGGGGYQFPSMPGDPGEGLYRAP